MIILFPVYRNPGYLQCIDSVAGQLGKKQLVLLVVNEVF